MTTDPATTGPHSGTADRSADSFPRQYARTQRLTLGEPRSVQLVDDGTGTTVAVFLRSDSGADPVNHLWSATADGVETKLADARQLLGGDDEDLPPAERARRERAREGAGGITSYSVGGTGRECAAVFALGGRLFSVPVFGPADAVGEVPVGDAVFDPRPSPDGTHIAVVIGRELRVLNADGTTVASVIDADPAVTWGSADFVAAEEMQRQRGFWWSPDGETIAACRNDVSAVNRWFIAQPADPAAVPVEHRYPQAGTANPQVSLWLIGEPVNGRPTRQVEVVWDRERLPYLAAVHWRPAGLTITVQSRDQRDLEVRRVDIATGHTETIFADHDDRWVELVDGAGFLTDDGALVHAADRGGARRLMIDGSPVSPPDVQVRAILGATQDAVWVTGNPLSDASVQHVYAWRHGAFEPSTHQPGVHNAVVASAGLAIRSADLQRPGARWTIPGGHTLVSHAENPLVRPLVQLLGDESFSTAVLLPSNIEQLRADGRRLPVLVDPYGGPHAQRVVQSHNAMCASQWFADQGFAVVVTDGRGTPGRGSTYERAVYHDLADGVLDDQIAGLMAAAERFPDLDLSRVAIRGWSFGGYLAALAVLKRPDVFHAAVAGAPVTEWRLYDTHYTERYLGDPNEDPAVYDANSLLPLAPTLDRPILFIHGLADDNVSAAHTLQMSSALLAAGRAHQVLPLVGVTHMTPQEVVAENLLLAQLDFIRTSLAIGARDGSSGAGYLRDDETNYGGPGMNDRLSNLYRGIPVGANADSEHIAALELLVLVMVADREIDSVEVDEIKEITDDWRNGDFTFEKYLQPAVDKAQQAVADGETVAMIDDIDGRISSRVLRRALFSAARDVAGVDHDVSPEEGSILAEVAVRFS